MASETLVEYTCPISTAARKIVGVEAVEAHNYKDEAVPGSSAQNARKQPAIMDGETRDNLSFSPQHRLKQDSSSRQTRRTMLLPASGVTTDFDELRFEAAAARQLRFRTPEGTEPLYSSPEPNTELLISSPYNHPHHLLDLTTLNKQNRLLALALAALKPVRLDYATADYLQAFNWTEVLRLLRLFAQNEGTEWREQRFYTVVFRSKLNANIDEERLGELDQHSHREATQSGGLLKYWFGKAGPVRRENLATCIWRSREDAVRGGAGPWHALAMGAKVEMYESIGLKRCFLVVGDGARDVRMEEV
ncbi:hypothetical protein FKW77_006179 [Venturia effusa]|uniref:Uncharacterized protein n=1 Tax=Venturia effusa TaxID=50376 RepID=A0A517KZK1_9PEZI|nr:hypothetical protein FKW77_006179 [Venturia effusa]